MKDMGKLIVSTKAVAAGRKIYIFVFSSIMILFGVIGILNPEMHKGAFLEAFIDIFGVRSAEIFPFVASAIFIGAGAYALIASYTGFKSYCDVYENGVVGTSGKSANKNAAPQQNFELSYADIVNATESGKTIFIYTVYGNFEVLALKNRVKATQEIRKRMKGMQREAK